LAERVLGKDEVTSSILVIGSSLRSRELRVAKREQVTAKGARRSARARRLSAGLKRRFVSAKADRSKGI
jgi:hypothetical protein